MTELLPPLSPTALKISETDVLNDLLRDKRSPNTKRAYQIKHGISIGKKIKFFL